MYLLGKVALTLALALYAQRIALDFGHFSPNQIPGKWQPIDSYIEGG
jgi:hypothetical protein